MITAKDVKVYENTDTDTPFFPMTGHCRHCSEYCTGYAYYDCGSHIARKCCSAESCREKAVAEVVERVNNG